MFMEMSKLQSDVPPSSSGSKIVRYGITFKTSMLENADVDSDAVNEIDRFFFLYFKVLISTLSNATTERMRALSPTTTTLSSTLTLKR